MPSSRSLPLRQRTLRDHNLGVALGLIAESATPLSRAQLAVRAGVTRATASTLAEQLIAGGLLTEEALPPTARSGRPAVGLHLSPNGPCGVGIEINVDYVAVAVANLNGELVQHAVHTGDQRGRSPAEIIRSATQASLVAVRSVGLPIAGVTVAVPGLVEAGRVLLAPNLGWRDVDVLQLLGRTWHRAGFPVVPITVDNEANCAAVGEVSDTSRNFLYVSGDIGIGAGIVLQGTLYRGSHGWAGEIGHLTVNPTGPPCPCGSNGCLEVYAGQEVLRRAAGAGQASGTFAQLLAERAERGDPAVLAALRTAALALGAAVASTINLVDLSEVVLGGSYAPLSAWLVPTVHAELNKRVVWSALRACTVRPSGRGSEGAVRGAARSVIARVLSEPETWLVTRSLSPNAPATLLKPL